MNRQPPQQDLRRDEIQPGTSNLTLLIIAAAFLCVTIVLVLLQPGIEDAGPTPVQTAQAPAALSTPPTPVALAEPQAQPLVRTVAHAETVTRAEAPLLETAVAAGTRPLRQITPTEVALKLRQPIRLAAAPGSHPDLSNITASVLTALFAPEPMDLALRDLVVESILQRQSNTYLTVVLSTAAGRGQVQIPQSLIDADGRIDSQAMMHGIMLMAGEDALITIPLPENGTHIIAPGDSLAGLALRYYGAPFEFHRIATANKRIGRRSTPLAIGAEIRIPPL